MLLYESDLLAQGRVGGGGGSKSLQSKYSKPKPVIFFSIVQVINDRNEVL